MRVLSFAASLLAITLAAPGCRATPTSSPELDALLAGARPDRVADARWQDVQAFYAARERTLAWVKDDRTTDVTAAALDAVRAAELHGLSPDEYGEPALQAEATSLQSSGKSPDKAAALAALDVRITTALLQLGHHVATGRVSPKTIDKSWNARRTPPDVVAALNEAADTGVESFLDKVQPVHPEYAALKGALAGLRGTPGEGWPTVPATPLKRGQTSAATVVPLRQRLAAGGYLPRGAALDAAQFDADVETAVKEFQEHHGLPASGVLDRTTIQRLNVPRSRRLEQVALNLERWRWLPDDLGARHFLVNVPYFHLLAREQGKPVLDIRVVVGKHGNETPLFSDEMETVVFSPYWNVPETIALEETAPAAMRDPEYLSRNNMEVVDKAGQVIAPAEIPWDDETALQAFRFRQRPGATNALGYVKFLFPNEHAVYLHDTPADALFQRIGRAFSHGCVRVEEPETLAQYVLRDQPEWTDEAIRTAMRSGSERHVKLAAPIPVHIVYLTAWVDAEGGLHFEDDVYGYDARQARR